MRCIFKTELRLKRYFTIFLLASSLNLEASEGLKYSGLTEVDLSFILICSGMVFLMQMGFMCLESGSCHKKNSINVAVKNLTDFMVSSAIFWIIGFGIMFGKSISSIIGCSNFASDFTSYEMATFFIFQMMFCGTASTINSGAISGRAKFSTYIIMTIVISGIIYPVFGHWTWSGLWNSANSGWLESLGFMDFAGSSVVHSLGGWVALAAIMIIGPRNNRFDKNGQVNYIRPSSFIHIYIGTFVLSFGWLGFNAGSNLSVDKNVAFIAINTFISACFGGLTALFFNWWIDSSKTPQPEVIANGFLSGLVGITASCAWVNQTSAAFIGIISGIIFVFSSRYIQNKLKLDDVVDAVSVHGTCGAWGTLAVGFFCQDEFLSTTRPQLLLIQAFGILCCFIWSFGISWLIFKFLHEAYSLRVSEEDEEVGLNLSEHSIQSDE